MSKILTEQQVKEAWDKLNKKFGVEIQELENAIIKDTTLYGVITAATQIKQKALLDKISKEKPEEYE